MGIIKAGFDRNNTVVCISHHSLILLFLIGLFCSSLLQIVHNLWNLSSASINLLDREQQRKHSSLEKFESQSVSLSKDNNGVFNSRLLNVAVDKTPPPPHHHEATARPPWISDLIQKERQKPSFDESIFDWFNDTTAANRRIMRKKVRRTKVHYCRYRHHTLKPIKMLMYDYDFNEILVRKTRDWDMIFGGYMHCHYHGLNSPHFDWDQVHGVNAVLNRRGWSSLEPHQIWYPCMGCRNTFCHKRGLCTIQRNLEPDLCFVLPEDRTRLLRAMKEQQQQQQKNGGVNLWVVKRDGNGLHLHLGQGTRFISSPHDLPSIQETMDETYIVQAYRQPLLGEGKYHRKAEIRVPLAITSTTPMRAYIYQHSWVNLAKGLYPITTSSDAQSNSTSHGQSGNLTDRCLQLNNVHTVGCEERGTKNMNINNNTNSTKKKNDAMLSRQEQTMSFPDYARAVGLSEKQQRQYWKDVQELLRKVIQQSLPTMVEHRVNRGITTAGAMCFSYLRADMGIVIDNSSNNDDDNAPKPFLYEVNEFPSPNSIGFASDVISWAYNDLFQMIGLDQPPVPVQGRADYERKHHGNWTLFYDSSLDNYWKKRIIT